MSANHRYLHIIVTKEFLDDPDVPACDEAGSSVLQKMGGKGESGPAARSTPHHPGDYLSRLSRTGVPVQERTQVSASVLPPLRSERDIVMANIE